MTTATTSEDTREGSTWLLRVPEVFGPWRGEVLAALGARMIRALGREYLLVAMAGGRPAGEAAMFVSWCLSVGHAWPCQPRKLEGFVEKAARGLEAKFGGQPWQAVLVGALDPGDHYYRTLASNLRGRALQVLDHRAEWVRDAQSQDPTVPSLFVMVGREGVFAGVGSPAETGGFFPGGTRFIRQAGGQVISRAGAKIAEALHHLPLAGLEVPAGAHWLELGASPGGMTAELLDRGFRVTAVDRAPLDARLDAAARLSVVLADAGEFVPPRGATYDAILSDMNGEAVLACAHVVRLTRWLKPGGLVVFTLKLGGVDGYGAVTTMAARIRDMAAAAGLRLRACRHLTYNRMEFTCLFEYQPEAV